MTQADSRRKWNINIFAFTKACGAATLGTQCKRGEFIKYVFTGDTEANSVVPVQKRTLFIISVLARFFYVRKSDSRFFTPFKYRRDKNAAITLDPHKHICFCPDL